MTTFHYEAKTLQGKSDKGVIEADSLRQAREQLLQKNLLPIKIISVKKKHKTTFLQRLNQRIKTKQMLSITRQLGTLISASVPVDEALSAVIEQEEATSVRTVMLGVRARVLEGLSLSQAMGHFPHAFPTIYLSTIAAGEQAGRLDTVLRELADYTTKQQRLKQQIQQAMLYPIVMLIVSLGVVTYLLSAVVPKILQVVEDAHQALPWQTELLLKISHAVTHDGLWMLAGLVSVVVLIRYGLSKRSVKRWWQTQLIKVPVVGKLLISLNVARFARTLSIATAAGVPILDGLRHAKDSVSLIPLNEKITTASDEVREGASIHHAFRRSGAFPTTFTYLIASGENSGQLDRALAQAADDEQEQLEAWIKSALTLFEPIMILVMGGIVLFIVLAILVPIFNLDQIAGG